MLIRSEMLKAAKEPHNYWDIVIIGGGASGLWCALDSVTRGYKTLLVEKNDFAGSASSKSTKLIHGGVRYLKQGHASLVREALLERGYLYKNAPHLVSRLPFIIGCYKWWEKAFYRTGLYLYDGLATGVNSDYSRSYSASECLSACPTINSEGLRGGVCYYDGQFDDARLSIELAKTIELFGGSILNYCEVKSFLKASGKVCGVLCQDKPSRFVFEIQAKVVINATGVFTDETLKLDTPERTPMMALSRGTHIIVGRDLFPSNHAFLIPKTSDDRVIFLIPWLGKVLIGTTDEQTNKPLTEPLPTEEETAFLLKEVSPYLSRNITKDDILSVFAGLRPLVRCPNTKKTAKLIRKHKIDIAKSGLITLTGGKWTIARKMAEDCIDKAIETGKLHPIYCKTKQVRLHRTPFEQKGELLHPNLPYYEGDLEIAVKEEMVTGLTDLLARRTRALLLDAEAAISIAPKAAEVLAKEFGFDERWKQKNIEEFSKFAENYLPLGSSLTS